MSAVNDKAPTMSTDGIIIINRSLKEEEEENNSIIELCRVNVLGFIMKLCTICCST